MKRLSVLLVSCLLCSTATADFGSAFSAGLDAVGKPLASGFASARSGTVDAAKSVGDGLQTVGRPVGSAVVTAGKQGAVAAETVGLGLQRELQTVKQPIDVTVIYVASSQCENVKKLFGLSYDQMRNGNEPNLNELELVYKTKYFTTTVNITYAAEFLRQAQKFNQDDRLVVFCHGFTDNPSKTSFSKISDSYFEKNSNMSIIALDSSKYIGYFYLRSSTYVTFIGQKLAEIFATLIEQGLNPALIHLVGHSLGAHIVGNAGKKFHLLTGQKIGRITGLDPAGPCFTHLDPELRLKKTDGAYVDVIHTDAGVYGLRTPVGQKDYFPNNGEKQPNCLLQTCSHSRVIDLYAESVVNPEVFPSVRCDGWDSFKKGDCDYNNISYMGYESEAGEEGLYYLQTNISSPYGLGSEGCIYRNNEGVIQNIVDVVV